MIDFDQVEVKNFNRVLKTTFDDAKNQLLKVDVFKNVAAAIRPSTPVNGVALSLEDPHAVELAAAGGVLSS